ncbi:hypothetical protein Ga0074812_14845 [Parafrankia irregularis]|uniref:Uncharacterized protein n=2 Tax=Parafrankia TaxID=2994362 RepID=A0A0S4QZ68_9ACTN|nr:hypothetical protein [Parafrankia irregularis]CUU60845.1 hypothetical protein Ga0074812_14845 [Parafrankia irregularis]
MRDASHPIPPAEYVRVVQERDTLQRRVDELEARLCQAKAAAYGVAVAGWDSARAGRRRSASTPATIEESRELAWAVSQDQALAIAVYFATDRHPPNCLCSAAAASDPPGWDAAHDSIIDYWPSHTSPDKP